MAPESCNLGKDEAELLKPSSPSSSSSSSSSSPPILLMELFNQDQISDERQETLIVNSNKVSSLSKLDEEPYISVPFCNRCSTCQKRIGLTGFRCRCGDLFCARHRYSDTHGCSFDYKAAGREEISKANPVIRAAKIIKI